MLYIRILFVMFFVMCVVYYIILFGHMFHLWNITYEKITFKGMLIPFYYLNKLKNF